MFENRDFPKSLDEVVFEQWLENGRRAKAGYHYLLVLWDEYEREYKPVYLADRNDIEGYQNARGSDRFIAAYDLYSESRIL